MKRGFTLIELLVTITVLAILVTIIVVLVDPAEIFRKTRDARRMADLASIREALTFASVNSGGTFDLDGANSGTCSDEAAKTIYVSVPLDVSLHAAPSGWVWRQVAKNSIALVNGSGWISANFTGAAGGSPIFNLPVDPRNTSSTNSGQRFFYSYACRRGDGKIEINARFESADIGPGGQDDKSIIDGGDVDTVYELGSASNVLPIAGVY
ncbi:MAG: hypothetical protein UT82_C0038G0011 [Parcubacteria group bacterium GW2011_GWB1_40_14]|nr:MAG: hypothetical protein UT82_C0038G0011 [Parcubacteria group bacterium GW2011_GWB1_40_14]